MVMNDTPEQRVEAGLRYYDSSNYQEAIKEYDKAIELNPNHINAWYNKALSLGALQLHEEAIEAYNRVVAIEPNYANAWYNKGLASSSLKKYGEAIEAYDKAISIESNFANAWYNKGLAYDGLKKYREAIEAYDKSIEIDFNYWDVWFNKGLALYSLKKYDESIECYNRAIEINPYWGEAWYNKGISLEALGKRNLAVKYFKKARELRKEIRPKPFEVSNLSSHIASDLWVEQDTLDYEPQVEAIIETLTNKNTKPPVAISIQAPWGGGKTSVMRMIRNKLDPYAAGNEKIGDAEGTVHSKVSLRELKSFLSEKKLNENKLTIPESALPPKGLTEGRVTIWFNAWKYESTEQVWSGLADSIIRGISNRMINTPLERQWFLLQLNLHREGADNVLSWLTSYSLSYLWQRIRPVVWGSIAAVGTSAIIALFDQTAGALGILGGSGLGGISSLLKKIDIENKPPDFALGSYLKIPDYSKKLGYIHAAVEDLKIIFKTIPKRYLPLIIFVDDLDRCSPKKVAEVIEGINLFLAGDFESCIFVIGMDAEMVAASLESAHSETISKLPEYSTHTPIGWRFMDKFIQLPILLPPIRQSGLSKYIQDILAQEISKYSQKETDTNAHPNVLDSIVESEQLETEEHQTTRDNKESVPGNTQSFDNDPEVSKQISKAASEFSSNPRDIKRFVNLLRYYYNLRNQMIGKYQIQETPTMDQIRRWTILLLKWPQLVRWLYWSPGGLMTYEMRPELHPSPTSIRLLQLEKLGRRCKDQAEWMEKLKFELNIKGDSISNNGSIWINDKNLRQFFESENQLIGEKPLSSSAGLGLY
jgi:tetratricopeptide (TPR) repeat protein